MILRPAPVSTDRLHYTPARNEFTAEISDLGRGFNFGRVYDDACDVGVTVVSARTGREIVFAVEHEDRDREGELLSWTLRPANRNEWGAGSLVIFND